MENYNYLIRIPNHLGDTIMAQPAVRSFVELFGNEKIVLLLPEWAENIYRGFNAKLIKVPSNKLHGFSAITYQSKLLRQYKIKNGILMTPSFSSALILYLSGIKNRYGYSDDGRGLLLNKSMTLPESNILHRAEKYKLLLEKAGDTKLENSTPNLTIPDPVKSETINILSKFGLNLPDKYIVIAPQAIAESRRWGTDNYSTLAHLLIDKYNIKIVLVGTADQFKTAQIIADDNKNIINLCGQTNIIQAASVLSSADLFIGNDSGLAHLASAVETSLLILSGADDPKETSPLSNKKNIIIKSNLDCISCVKNICPKSGEEYMKCMKDISVNEVFETVSITLGLK